jgi:zeaxanthin glucosyltransferase
LSNGVVTIPVASDQPAIAARIAYRKVDKFILLADLAVPLLRTLIEEVLSDPVYRENANQMRVAI